MIEKSQIQFQMLENMSLHVFKTFLIKIPFNKKKTFLYKKFSNYN